MRKFDIKIFCVGETTWSWYIPVYYSSVSVNWTCDSEPCGRSKDFFKIILDTELSLAIIIGY